MGLDEVNEDEDEAEGWKEGSAPKRKDALLALWRYKDDTKEFDCSESFRID